METNQIIHEFLTGTACVCPCECDCQDFERGLISNECPAHNDDPQFVEGCPVHNKGGNVPAYDSDPAACLDLIAELADDKAYFVSMATSRHMSKTFYHCRLTGLVPDSTFESEACESLPAAVANAVRQLAEKENYD